MCNCFCSVIVLCGMMIKGREKVKPGADSQPALHKSTKGAARLNVPIRRTNRYQQYYMPSQHTSCGRVWNLIQDCDVQSSDQKVYISTPPSPEVENFQIKIYYPAGDRTPDLLNLRQTCYHLSQRGEQHKHYDSKNMQEAPRYEMTVTKLLQSQATDFYDTRM